VTCWVALLRGINVGGHAIVPMADLRRIAEGCGLTDVQTYIQSGNLLFTSEDTKPTALATRLRSAIERDRGIAPSVILRTREELASVVADCPFDSAAIEPRQLHVAFGEAPLAATVLRAMDLAAYAPDRIEVRGREVYLSLPDGIGGSKLVADVTRRAHGTFGTVRNWRTVLTLLRLANEQQC
jgi:uncharacterized protein (DUF1697 family)